MNDIVQLCISRCIIFEYLFLYYAVKFLVTYILCLAIKLHSAFIALEFIVLLSFMFFT